MEWLEYQNLSVAPPPDMTVEQWLAHMARDKKVIDGRLRLVLLRAIGDACVVDDVSTAALEAFLAPFCAC